MGMFTLAFFANCCPWTAVRAMWTFRLIDIDICQNTESRHSWARTCRTRLRQMRHRSNARDTRQLPHTNSNTTHTHLFNGPLSRTTRISRYQKGKTNLDFTEARDSEWHWHQLGHMQVCTSLQTDNHESTSPLSFSQAGCPFCCSTNSVKALKANTWPRYQE